MNKTSMWWRPGAADSLRQADIPPGTIFDVYAKLKLLPLPGVSTALVAKTPPFPFGVSGTARSSRCQRGCGTKGMTNNPV